jgi:hypothetical protein
MMVVTVVLLAHVMMVNLIVVMAIAYLDHGNVMYTGVTVPIALMKRIVVIVLVELMVVTLVQANVKLVTLMTVQVMGIVAQSPGLEMALPIVTLRHTDVT